MHHIRIDQLCCVCACYAVSTVLNRNIGVILCTITLPHNAIAVTGCSLHSMFSVSPPRSLSFTLPATLNIKTIPRSVHIVKMGKERGRERDLSPEPTKFYTPQTHLRAMGEWHNIDDVHLSFSRTTSSVSIICYYCILLPTSLFTYTMFYICVRTMRNYSHSEEE